MTPPRELARLEPPAPSPARTPAAGARDWPQLVQVHQHRVVLSLLAAGFSFDRCQELANEAWARLIEKDRAGQLGELKLPGLAIVQARFLAGDQRRRDVAQARRQSELGGEAVELLVDRHPDPEQRLLDRQQASRALGAIAAAPTSAQRLFRLLYAQPGLSHAEAARALGLSLQRVRQILCELRKQVRLAMEGDPR